VQRRSRGGGPAATPSSVPSTATSPPPRRSLGARLRYRFDAALSRGPSVVIGWLGVLTLAIILFSALILTLIGFSGVNGGGELGFAEAFWQSMLRIVDAGTFAGDTGWGTRLLGLTVTLAGIFLAGSLIGLIASAVDQRIELLRKGRSNVLEEGHSLVLGWSDRVPAIVRELVTANESERRAAVVVLAPVDKTTMEDTLRDAVGDFKTTRLVCRSGDTSSPADLDIANLSGARSVVVIGGNDAAAVKTLLAIRAADPSRTTQVIVEIDDAGTARSVSSLFGDRVVIVNSDDVVAELTAQACRQRGLSQVFRDLLDFDGDEIYFDRFPELVGHRYAEALVAFEHSCIMGRITGDGRVELNPAADTVIDADDRLIGLSADDSLFVCTGLEHHPVVPGSGDAPAEPTPRRMVLVGWSGLGPRVISELDEFLGPETTIEVVVDPDQVDPDDVRSSVVARNVSVEVSTHGGGPEEVAIHAARLAFHEIIVLGRRDGVAPEHADAATLLTLLAFKQIVTQRELGDVRIVAELLEQRHAALAQATGADDFIVSDELTSLMIAQLSERPELDIVFRDLFDRSGCTIEIVPAAQLDLVGVTTFGGVVATASARGSSALGYRRSSDGVVVLNPPKRDTVTMHEADGVVLLR
jgi:voltage-gated potassium channel Kch